MGLPRACLPLLLLLAAAPGLAAPTAPAPAAAPTAQVPAAPARQAPENPAALLLGPEDVRIEQFSDGGYHLYIRKKEGLASVLLTESTKDPEHKTDNYAYRAPVWNAVNGDEKRMLDGAFIPAAAKLFSLIDSSPEPDPRFGEAYHVFIPWVVNWGYSWGRNGQTFIHDGTFINIRAFSRPYADYRGSFRDNPFLVRVVQVVHTPAALPQPPPEAPPEPPPEAPPEAPPPPPEAPPEPVVEKTPDLSRYIPKTVDDFRSIAEAGKGEARLVGGPDDITPEVARLMDRARGKSLDLVICLDTTDSMKDDIDSIKKSLPGLVASKITGFASFRIGLVLYKDYFEEYLTKRSDFTTDVGKFNGELQAVRVGGGRDIPEAVYEALYEALVSFHWAADEKMVILIGDAPPHPLPRGKIDRAMVEAESAKLGVELNTIILPN
jgi:hypothetical protein